MAAFIPSLSCLPFKITEQGTNVTFATTCLHNGIIVTGLRVKQSCVKAYFREVHAKLQRKIVLEISVLYYFCSYYCFTLYITDADVDKSVQYEKQR